MFHYGDMVCCSHCFEEMILLLTDDSGNPMAYICPKCGKIADLSDEL